MRLQGSTADRAKSACQAPRSASASRALRTGQVQGIQFTAIRADSTSMLDAAVLVMGGARCARSCSSSSSRVSLSSEPAFSPRAASRGARAQKSMTCSGAGPAGSSVARRACFATAAPASLAHGDRTVADGLSLCSAGTCMIESALQKTASAPSLCALENCAREPAALQTLHHRLGTRCANLALPVHSRHTRWLVLSLGGHDA